jgi:hypothetical protein
MNYIHFFKGYPIEKIAIMYLLFSQENKKSVLIFQKGYLQWIFNHQPAKASEWLPLAVRSEM